MSRMIRKGQIIAITTGEYSDYCLREHMRALRDFDPVAEAERFKPKATRDRYGDKDHDAFLAWLIRERIADPVPVDEVVELMLGAFGTLDIEVRPAEE